MVSRRRVGVLCSVTLRYYMLTGMVLGRFLAIFIYSSESLNEPARLRVSKVCVRVYSFVWRRANVNAGTATRMANTLGPLLSVANHAQVRVKRSPFILSLSSSPLCPPFSPVHDAGGARHASEAQRAAKTRGQLTENEGLRHCERVSVAVVCARVCVRACVFVCLCSHAIARECGCGRACQQCVSACVYKVRLGIDVRVCAFGGLIIAWIYFVCLYTCACVCAYACVRAYIPIQAFSLAWPR